MEMKNELQVGKILLDISNTVFELGLQTLEIINQEMNDDIKIEQVNEALKVLTKTEQKVDAMDVAKIDKEAYEDFKKSINKVRDGLLENLFYLQKIRDLKNRLEELA